MSGRRDAELTALREEVRCYTLKHPELRDAHHYDFGVLLTEQVDFWVLGLNPGETDVELAAYPGRGHLNPQNPADWNSLTPNAKRWISTAKTIAKSDNILLGDIFFWSSRSMAEFEPRYGYDLRRNPHKEFCARMLQRLRDVYPPRGVIVPGLGHAALVEEMFSLVGGEPVFCKRGRRLLLHYRDNLQTHWFVVRHFSRWLGATMKKDIGDYIANTIAAE